MTSEEESSLFFSSQSYPCVRISRISRILVFSLRTGLTILCVNSKTNHYSSKKITSMIIMVQAINFLDFDVSPTFCIGTTFRLTPIESACVRELSDVTTKIGIVRRTFYTSSTE